MKKLTECEEMVMSVIWDSDSQLNLPEILERVNKRYDKNWAMQTVSTFLARLRKKDVVQAKRTGRTFYYIVLLDKQDYIAGVAKNVCNMWFEGDVKKMVKAITD